MAQRSFGTAGSRWHRGETARWLAVPVIAASVLLAVPTAAQAQPAQIAQPAQVAQAASAKPPGDPVVVSLGDSYIAGTGGRWAGNSDDFLFNRGGTDRAWSRGKGQFFGHSDRGKVYGSTAGGCYRSDSAPIISATKAGLSTGRPVNLACSGARAVNVLRASAGGVGIRGEKPQDDQLAALARTSRVKLIVLSIGGNDLSFPDLVFQCITAYTLRGAPCKTKQQPRLNTALPEMQTAVGAVLDDVKATMRDAGYADSDYRLILQSYPNPLPTAQEDKYSGHWRVFKWTGGRCPFTDPDETWTATTLTPEVTGTLEKAAQQHGASFLDLSNAFDGHELCAAGTSHPLGDPTAAHSEWVRFVDYSGQGEYAESLHPNYFGQQAVGRCIAKAAAQTGDFTCTGVEGKGLDGLRLTPR